ncbi:GtrA family protein [Carbonactinospora thermoautotrophica]|uniref:GtrA family protein n=1 Tax=Carbonactinospora thermoautotrophica TaxID=1469144 RepID=UPI00082AF1EE|nr:GtrA family protein [Carbonactinospora thermoautotrophica]
MLVRVVHALYERSRMLIHEVTKFGLVGLLNVFVNMGVFNLTIHTVFERQPVRASALATVVATISAYLLNKYWTFSHREGNHGIGRETVLFFVLNGVGFLIEQVAVTLTWYVLGLKTGLWANAGKFLGIALGTAFRFWSYRKWVWAEVAEAGEATRVAAEADPEREGVFAEMPSAFEELKDASSAQDPCAPPEVSSRAS